MAVVEVAPGHSIPIPKDDPPAPNRPRRADVPFIDALRGIAFLGVFACHASLHLAPLGIPGGLVWLGSQGGIGVQLFFIASALTLMLSLDASSGAGGHPLRDFYLRRFFRIAPLFYLAIFFYGALFDGNGDGRVPHPLTVGSYVSTLTFTNGWSPRCINQVVPGGWSISVEMTFYLMVPFLHARLKSFRQALLCAVAIYLAGAVLSAATLAWLEGRGSPEVPGMDEAFVHYWMPAQLYRFFAGFSLYFLVRDRIRAGLTPSSPRRDLIGSLALLAASLAIFALSAFGRLPRFVSTPACTSALFFFGWSLAVAPLRPFVNAATRLVGRLSFAAYVSHFAALDAVDRICRGAGFSTLPVHWSIKALAFLMASLSLTLLASELLHRWVERPGQSYGRRLIARLGSRDAASPRPAGPP